MKGLRWFRRKTETYPLPAFVRLDLAYLCLNCNMIYARTTEGGCELCGSKLIIALRRYLDLQRARIRARLRQTTTQRPIAVNDGPCAKVNGNEDTNLPLYLTAIEPEALPTTLPER